MVNSLHGYTCMRQGKYANILHDDVNPCTLVLTDEVKMAAPKGNQYAKGKATGRPVIYDDERMEEEANALLEWISVDGENKIYLGSFARSRGYDRHRLSEFARDNKVFSAAYKLAKAWQEEKFIRYGLTRVWDATFTDRVMARVCGDEWKNSWDQPEDKGESTPSTIIINKKI